MLGVLVEEVGVVGLDGRGGGELCARLVGGVDDCERVGDMPGMKSRNAACEGLLLL